MKIQTLDGKQWDKKELIDNMYEDSFYYGYLGKNAFSSSAMKMLLDSPKTYKYVTQYGSGESQALRDGKLFHTMMLEPEKIDGFTFVDVQSKNTIKYKEAVSFGGEVYTNKERKDAERLCDAIYKNEAARSLLIGCDYEIPEAGILHGYPFRAKADILGDNRIIDLKTTTNVKDFNYSAKKYRYNLQVYIYCQLFNVEFKDFKFICIDKGNLDIGIFDVSEEFYYSGEQLLDLSIKIYKECIEDTSYDVNDYVIYGTL